MQGLGLKKEAATTSTTYTENNRINNDKKTQKKKDIERKKSKVIEKKLELAEKKRFESSTMGIEGKVEGDRQQQHIGNTVHFAIPEIHGIKEKKLKDQMPKTPAKRASLVDTLSRSPSCHQLRMRTSQMKRKLEMADNVLDSLDNRLSMLRGKGSMAQSKKAAYDAVKRAILCKDKYGYTTAVRRKLRLSKRSLRSEGSWWETHKHKPRKDKITEITRANVYEFFMDGSICRVVPDARAAMKNDND